MDLPTAGEGEIVRNGDQSVSTEVSNVDQHAAIPTTTADNAHPYGDNKFQKAISAWRGKSSLAIAPRCVLTEEFSDIDLTKLVPELDPTATDIIAHQRDSVVARKDLAQKTKDFRKLEDAAKLVEYKSLLKCNLHPHSFALCTILTTSVSIPNFHRPPHEPWENYLIRISTNILLDIRGPRPLSFA